MMLSATEKRQIEAAIADAERKTSGEIVTVIAPASGTYFYVPYLWASLAALVMPWPLIHFTWLPVQTIYLLQLAVFAGLVAILHHAPFRFALVTPSLKRKTAHRRGVEQFLAQNLHTKPGHTGVLLFVSVAERYAEILADDAVSAKVSDAQWKTIVEKLTTDISEGQSGQGFVRAVAHIGEHLATHFPPSTSQDQALPNHLVILHAE